MTQNPLEKGAAFIEGEYVPVDEAKIPILDTGFLRSDVTYDVVHVWKGNFFRLEEHLDRFERSYQALRMKLPHTRDEIRTILMELVRRSGIRDAYVDMIATRGVDRFATRDPRRIGNRFYAYAVPFIWISSLEEQETGMDLIVSSVVRIPPESVDPTVKNFHWGDLVRGTFEAFDRGGKTPLLLDAEGFVTEGPGFNLFAVHEGRLLTPDRGVLEGITRRTVLELAAELGIDAEATKLKVDVLRDAEEIFCTSTAGGVMPVRQLDGQPVGDGKPGPVTQQLRDRYWAAHEEPKFSTPVEYS